ncbi:MAG: hypothetical protein HKP55_02815 [Gammaproteobacteria bacterium]|nr:hypothetical protein [Gammaproteobacteria bacterium]
MKLFIGNIPSNALLVDIHDFLGGLELRADFQAREGRKSNSECYHYVVAELSEKGDIDNLISRYDGMDFKGSPLVVREFFDRGPCCEWAGQEKRINNQ